MIKKTNENNNMFQWDSSNGIQVVSLEKIFLKIVCDISFINGKIFLPNNLFDEIQNK